MTVTLRPPTASAPNLSIEPALGLGAKSESLLFLASSETCGDKPCSIPIEVGLFFDGTNNNMGRDLSGQRIEVLSDKDLKKIKARAKSSGKDIQELLPPPDNRILPQFANEHQPQQFGTLILKEIIQT